MTRNAKSLDALRAALTPVENHLIDGYVDGRVSRREFLRHGSLLGLSLPFLGRATLSAGFSTAPSIARAEVKPGATIRVATDMPKTAIDPVQMGSAGVLLFQQVGEWLCTVGTDLALRPGLATAWKPNQDGSIWTFTLRKGVKFHSGGEMKADDVVATFNRLADPKNGSNALAVFQGVLQNGGTRKVDDYTVEFHLDGPNGNFPYFVSSDNYNSIILPASYSGDYEKTWDGTGPFKIDKYTQGVSANFVRNDNYWGPKALPARTEFILFQDIQPQILALQAGQVDIIPVVSAFSGATLLTDPSIDILSFASAAHEAVQMRCDTGPFKDPRIRQAVALCLDRDKLVKGLMKGRAVVGNDSPFAPLYPSTDPTVPQRKQDIPRARELMKAAGVEKGLQVTLTTEQFAEIPAYAQLIQSWVKEIGIDLKLKIMDQSAFYGDAVPGKSDWFDAPIKIADYGHRGVPNAYLQFVTSDAAWNASYFKNQEYDMLVKSYLAAFELEAQRAAAGKIQRLLLEETPQIFGYFYDTLTATKKGVAGVQATSLNLFLQTAGKA